jgi:hypothetical protein
VIFDWLTLPQRYLGDENNWVRGLECIRTELGEPDESGRRRPVPVPGSEFVIEADLVVIALGTNPNPLVPHSTRGLDVDSHGCIVADPETGATSRKGLFAGGDIVTGAATVILAMGAGRKSATAIHEYLQEQHTEKVATRGEAAQAQFPTSEDVAASRLDISFAEHEVEERHRGYGDGTVWARDYATANELRGFVESFRRRMEGDSEIVTNGMEHMNVDGSSDFEGPYWEGFLEGAEEVFIEGTGS